MKFMQLQIAGSLVLLTAAMACHAQNDGQTHRRGYKPLPDLAHIVVTVQKGYNGKPLENAAVIFHAVRDDRDDGSLEVKTDLDGNAAIDLIEVGSKVTLQVLADGFATYATDFDVDSVTKTLTVKLERPRDQISEYQDNTGKASERPFGVQEPDHVIAPSAGPAVLTATVSGTVTDASGARIQGAVVTITPQGLPDQAVKFATVKDGSFLRRGLKPGTYTISVQFPGFLMVTHEDVVLTSGDTHELDDKLQASPK